MADLTLSGRRIQGAAAGRKDKRKKKKGLAYASDAGNGDRVVSPKEDSGKRTRRGIRDWMMRKSKKWKTLMDAMD